MKARKLPSGSWRCQVYSHTEKIKLPDGTTKDKRIYKSFTCDIPGPQGRRACEKMAAEWAEHKEKEISRLTKDKDFENMTVKEAIDRYIETRVALNRSPTTINGYRIIQKNGFEDIMDMKLKDIDEVILQEAINMESGRQLKRRKNVPKTISAKCVKNEWGLIRPVIRKYAKGICLDDIELPTSTPRMVELPAAIDVLRIVRGTDIELPVLLAAWLSFSMSEVRGLTKSKSISGDYIMIREVVVRVGKESVRKELAKNEVRNRKHRIPIYIKHLIDQVDGDILVPMTGNMLYHKWIALQNQNGMKHITFHDLRHLNASIMALLRIPDKYAQERGGWASDKIMKGTYMQTFSDERIHFDNVMDEYFEKIMDSMQHEMQHKKEKA